MTASNQLQGLVSTLGQAQAGALPVDELARHWRGHSQHLLAALPPNFSPVMHNLLDRLESAASFTDESCSVSQRDLLAGLQQWVEKAALRLPPPASP